MGKVVLILTAVSAGLGLATLHLVKQLREGDATIAELKAQVATLQEQSAGARWQVGPSPSSEPSSSQPASALGELPPGIAPAAANVVEQLGALRTSNEVSAISSSVPSREERMRMMREHRERQRQLMQDPEYREAMRMQSRSSLARQFPGVIQELGLGRQQAEEFFNMLADQQMRSREQMQPMWDVESGETPDPATLQERAREIQQAAAEMQRRNEAEFASRFGQDKLQAWKEYQSTMGQRYQLEQMRSTLASQGLPLSEDAGKPMLKALAAAQQTEMDEYSAAVSRGAAPALARFAANAAFDGSQSEQQIESTRKRNQRTLDAISPYLSFEQRRALEKEQEAQLKMLEAQLRLMRNRGTATAEGYFVDGVQQGVFVPQ